ncbi:hypothetical protein [Thalassospira alkalitolerans]|uniref:Uncharacterized protein n=1 Tax=Thalassospira alkalitolerans TaxID=1293890 RepID=A0A1Y2LD69_9PROT|nr:hypothetical protein [Thalassospira alkalitolerans]OSQ48395.1 hypothetical protein TALK_09030 [Thalassospira alkalitolerans]|tara:strand:- start:21077 stop:21529 length:453 start_codon:yes stop_codon:yes gene_type:complete
MVTPVINSPSISQVSQHGRLMAAGARGVSTVDRSSQVEATSQHYSYDPDNDGILFNAYIDGKEGQHRHPGQGNPGDQKNQRAEQNRLSQARRASDREGAISSESDVDFASFLDPEIPFDLGANSGTSFYAVVNAVVHGAGVRGTRVDAYV